MIDCNLCLNLNFNVNIFFLLTELGGSGARRFFLAECRIDDRSGLPIWLIVSYSSSNGFELFTLSCDDPCDIDC